MRIQCDVYEHKPAAVICSADEAALCAECDVKVHQANKLANKHKRLPLMPSNSKLCCCDICQDKTAFVFCLEDRAMLCRDCDESVHSPDTLSAKHQRFLATGIRVALTADIPSNCENEGSTAPIAPNSAVSPTVSTISAQKQSTAHENYVEPCWSVDDLLPLSDFNSKGDQGNLGDFDWNIADMTFFGEEEQDSLLQVPQLSSGSHSHPSAMNIMCGKAGRRSNASPNKGKSKATQISQVPDYDEACFLVPDIGMLDTGCLNTLP